MDSNGNAQPPATPAAAKTMPKRNPFTVLIDFNLLLGIAGLLAFCSGLSVPSLFLSVVLLLFWKKLSKYGRVVLLVTLLLNLTWLGFHLSSVWRGESWVRRNMLVSARVTAMDVCCRLQLEEISLALNKYAKSHDGKFPSENGNAGLACLVEAGLLRSHAVQCPFIDAAAPAYNDTPADVEAARECRFCYFYNGGLSAGVSPPRPIAGDIDWAHGDWGKRRVLMSDGRIVEEKYGPPFKAFLEFPKDCDARTPRVPPPAAAK